MIKTTMCLAVALLAICSLARGTTYYVAPNGVDSDNNLGTEARPFKSVQKAINTAGAGDTIHIKAGTYDLSGFSKTINHNLALVGEDKNTTVLVGIGALTLSKSFTARNITFSDYQGTIFNLSVGDGEQLDGLNIDSCIFKNVTLQGKTRIVLGRYDVSPSGVITNVNISNCHFLGLTAPGAEVIYIVAGLISNINIKNNTFHDIISSSSTGPATAIRIGSNGTRSTTKDVLISRNLIDTVVGGTEGEIETHGILAYGSNINISYNTIINMNPGVDHEAIYMKAENSIISDNVMIDCTSNQGALAIKGSDDSHHNTVSRNKVKSNQSGRSIYITGGRHATVKDNWVKAPNGNVGIFVYEAGGTPVSIVGNYVEVKATASYLRNAVDSQISGNVLISYEGETIALKTGTSNTNIDGNLEYTGYPPHPPVAVASADVTSGQQPLTVNFSSVGSDDANGKLVSYAWDFHDGESSSEANPSHTYTNPRIYTATLIVTDEHGFKDMAYVVIRVTAGGGDPAPSAPRGLHVRGVSPN